jgi:hypothetical protein
MGSDDETSEERKKRARFARWEKMGVDRVKADLLAGGHREVGGPPAVRDLAWEWVRDKEGAQREQPEVLQLKPNYHGVGIDLKELGRRVRRFGQRVVRRIKR